MRILGRSIAGRRRPVRQRLVPLSLLSKLGNDEKWIGLICLDFDTPDRGPRLGYKIAAISD